MNLVNTTRGAIPVVVTSSYDTLQCLKYIILTLPNSEKWGEGDFTYNGFAIGHS